ncbi:hypothetical protein GCM10028819_51450 [Spirosoma humi]
MTLFQISVAVREVGGQVWHVDFAKFGSRIRAKVGYFHVRLIFLKPGLEDYDIPEEANSLLYVVSTPGDLKNWL